MSNEAPFSTRASSALEAARVLCSPDGHVLSATGPFTSRLEAEELPRDLTEYANDPAALKAQFRRAVEGAVANDELHELGRAFAEKGLWSVSVTPLTSSSGNVTCLLVDLKPVVREPHPSGLRSKDSPNQTAGEARVCEADLKSLISAFRDGIAIERHGQLLFVNDALVRYLGYENEEQLLNQSAWQLIERHTNPDTRRGVEDAYGATRLDAAPFQYETPLVTVSGKRTIARLMHSTVVLDGEPAVLTVVRDVTEARQMMTRLQQADRLASIGTLTAGVAHEVNNPLAYVVTNLGFAIGQLDRLRSELPAGEREAPLVEVLEALNDAADGAQRVARIVQGLRSFALDDSAAQAPVNLVNVLDQAAKMAENEIRYRAMLRRDMRSTPLVRGNESQLVQVFVNLLVNAAQSIVEGATERNFIEIRTREDGDRVTVEIQDTGSGMPPEMLSRIFDPFFTTKPVGVGTGLGLSICHGIIQSLGGTIRVESAVGEGSTVFVELPMVTEPIRKEVVRHKTIRPPSQKQSVLLIDDEPLILRSLGRVLERDYEVVMLTSARTALTRIKAGERFDVILCDMMMPDMMGTDFHTALARIDADAAKRVVFLTGGAFTDASRQYVDSVPNLTLQKPVTPRALRDFIRSMLTE